MKAGAKPNKDSTMLAMLVSVGGVVANSIMMLSKLLEIFEKILTRGVSCMYLCAANFRSTVNCHTDFVHAKNGAAYDPETETQPRVLPFSIDVRICI